MAAVQSSIAENANCIGNSGGKLLILNLQQITTPKKQNSYDIVGFKIPRKTT